MQDEARSFHPRRLIPLRAGESDIGGRDVAPLWLATNYRRAAAESGPAVSATDSIITQKLIFAAEQ
jgi:hypothetical protein